MNSRRLGLVIAVMLAGVAWSRAANAGTLTENTTDPLPLGNVVVGQTSAAGLVKFDHTGTQSIVTLTIPGTAACAMFSFTVTTPGGSSPWTVPAGTNSDAFVVSVTFTPASRGSQSCKVQVNGGGGPTFTVSGAGVAPISTVSADNGPPLNFGSVQVGQNDTFNVTISNTTSDAGQNLHFASAFTLTGANAGDYTITSANPPADVPPSMSTIVAIKFAPTALLTRNATLNITSNDPLNSPQTVALTGVGTSNASISVAPTVFTYANITAGTTSTHDFTVTNGGTAGVLTLSGATLTGATSSWFTFTNAPAGNPNCNGLQSCTYTGGNTINPGGNLKVTVACSPPVDTTGMQMATLTIGSDSTTAGNNTATLTCTAVKPDIAIMPASLMNNFGNVHVGNSVPFSPLTIQNTGGAPLNFTIARSSTGSSGDFTLTGPGCSGGNTCSGSIAATSSASYTVTFLPSAMGPRSATLTITSNDQDPGDSPQAFNLSGVGTQVVVAAVPPSGSTINFGNVPVATESATQTVTITDNGNEDMLITSATLTGAEAGDFLIKSGMQGAQTVTNGGGSATWTIDCKPTVRGARTAGFSVASSNGPAYSVTLDCNGTGANLVASMNPVAFGNVREGMVVPIMFNLTNNGEATATISSAVLAPANIGYTFSGVTAGDTIASGASKQITVTFSPVAGMDGGNATLTIGSNAVNTPTVVNITGAGQPFGISITCPDCSGLDMDYGDVRWDQTKNEVFTITNTATADVTIEGIALDEVADFTLVTPPATPFVLHAGNTKTVTVQAAPNDTMLGTFTGHLQVMTDLPSPMMLVSRNLSVTSVSPALTVTPGMTVDFGGVDLDGTLPATMVVTVQNTGDGAMDINNWPALTGGPFTSPAGVNGSIAAGGMQSVTVSYTPTSEKTAAAPDTIDLVLTINGLFSAGVTQPSLQKITMTGHGIDRHIQLQNSPLTFPATFDNPTDAESPPLSCDIKNTGEASLIVTGVMLDNSSSPAFTLLDTQGITVPGGGTASFHVSFKPPAPGTNYNATLVLMHNDNGTATPHVSDCIITGSAVGRMVDFMPNTVLDLGITGVGVPVTLSDKGMAVQLVNRDATHTFAVAPLMLSGDTSQFTVVANDATTIAPNQTLSYDVSFDPTQAGDFAVTVTVYVDGDPNKQGQIMIKGTAVDVEVRGGGCDSGRGGGWGALVLIAILAIGVRRRRVAAAAGLFVLMLALAHPATAGGPSRDVDLETFAPAPTTEVQGFEVEGTRVGESGAWALGVVVDNAANPLHVESPGLAMEDHPVTSRTAFDVGFAYAFGGRFEAGARLPVIDQSGDKPMFSGLQPAGGAALGDAALHAKMKLVEAGDVGVAASATVTVPSHSSDEFAGTGPSGLVTGILGWGSGRIGASVNAGVLIRKTAALGDLEQGNAIAFGAGASYRAGAAITVIGELFGERGLSGSATAGTSPMEALIGARYRMGGGVDVAAGFGRGLMPGIGAPDYRGFVQLTFAPRERTEAALPASTGDEGPKGRDMRDDDGDGIPNYLDKCPEEAEDKDGFQDADGCPDPDNDGDGIPDAQDKCPNEAEDKDGFQDADGCDDPDNDHDGIPDVTDQCATEPETINGIQDEDGCPDKGDSAVMVQADRIEIFEPIVFNGQSATIDRKSANVLGQVASTLRANPEFKRVRVTVHVQPRNGDDEDLTEKRAEAVRQWLVKRGIEPERLEAKGMGSSRPLVPRSSKGAAAINDRVEFIIMEKK